MAVMLAACNQSGEQAGPETRDSLLKAVQKKKADSLKASNPLLIIPPDSSYTGTYIDRYPNGIVKFRGFFRQGKRHGQWVSFYPAGTPWSEMHYDKGLRHGPNITYFENGKRRYEGLYVMDRRDSVWNYFDTTGKAVKRVYYKRDAILRQEDIDPAKPQ